MAEFIAYLQNLIEIRRTHPADDLVNRLTQAETEGEKLSEQELIAMILLLLVAGHETTVNLIGNSVLALLQYLDQLARLKQDPSLIKPAIEELLRYNGPLMTGRTRRKPLWFHPTRSGGCVQALALACWLLVYTL